MVSLGEKLSRSFKLIQPQLRQAAVAKKAAEPPAWLLPDNPFVGLFNGARQLLEVGAGVPLIGTALGFLAGNRPARPKAPPTPPPSIFQAHRTAPVHQVQVVSRSDSPRWAWTELLRDVDSHLPQRNFHPRQAIRDEEIATAFGSDTPKSTDFLLHYAGDPPPGVKKHPVPVVLVHGASKNGAFWWDPKEDGSEHGLPQYLRDRGYHVYFMSFAHSHDDNFVWAQQTANCIDRVKQLTGATQVDLLGHSKGGVPARMYASDFREDWMTKYRGDVRKLLLVAAPNGGIDYSFRHPVANIVLGQNSSDARLNAPMSWNSMWWGVGMRDTSELGFGKDGPDYFPGQRQLLARLDDRHPLPIVEQDWYTTYYGGRGFVSTSSGIDHWIEQSGHFMERLGQTPIDPQVEVSLLAGNNPNIPFILNEYTGESDGLLFLDSALQMPAGTKVAHEKVMPLHHKALVSEEKAYRWIEKVLSK
jgi:triacylglycerol esterase/lipase EstA (alpha/beta hydrolase family)